MLVKALKYGVQFTFAMSFAAAAHAQQEIKIGVVYPLTGAAASSGNESKNAIELAVEIINNGAKSAPGLPFSAGGGLPNLKGAKIKLVFGDHQGNPQIGATETERLITQEKVVGIVGAYFSNVTATSSQIAERNKIPFVNPDSTSPTLTQRNFKYFFRTTAHDDLFVANFYEFFKDLEAKKAIKVKTVGLFNENTQWGNETTKLEDRISKERGIEIVKSITYPAKSTQLTSEIQSLKSASPQVVMQSSYLGDAIMAMKTYKELGYSPDMILANNAGFTDAEFIKTLGKDADYVITRDVWALDLAKTNPLIKQVNDLYLAKYKTNLTGITSRAFTGMMVMADAINRAGSAEPEAIRKALAETNITGDKTIMPWKGIKFDEKGQNTLASGILVQIKDGKYHTVWPLDMATTEVIWPMPKWSDRK